jgi:predicted MPP superfamily phosphohydrolase
MFVFLLNKLDIKNKNAFLFIPILGSLIYFLIQNIIFIKSGLLDPNFDVIFECYKFNLNYLPRVFLVLSLIYFVLLIALRPFRKLGLIFALFSILISISLFALDFYITKIEPEKLLIRNITLTSDKITKSIKVVHFSDVQSAKIGDYEKRIFKTIQKIDADLILYTGDFLQLPKELNFKDQWEQMHRLFDSLNPGFGIYAVYGDTELALYSVPKDEILPIQILSSKADSFAFEGGNISIYGLSLYNSKNPLWAMRGIETWLKENDDSHFKILLGHSPDYALALKDSRIDLCLAGHTHGGQVRIPFIGPLTIDSQIPKKWSRGFHKIGIPYLNVSAGAGSNHYNGLPAMRFNCPTEITVINIVPQKD